MSQEQKMMYEQKQIQKEGDTYLPGQELLWLNQVEPTHKRIDSSAKIVNVLKKKPENYL